MGDFQRKPGLSAAVFFLLLLLNWPASVWASQVKINIGRKPCSGKVRLRPGASAGYHQLLSGYKGYGLSGALGVDAYISRPQFDSKTMYCTDNYMLRASLNYFPMKLPAGVYNISEDIYSLQVGVVHKWSDPGAESSDSWTFFLGLGVGYYLDRVKTETPASGSLGGLHKSIGLTPTVGFFGPTFSGIRVAPELRGHMLKVPDGWAMSGVLQLSFIIWFEESNYAIRKKTPEEPENLTE